LFFSFSTLRIVCADKMNALKSKPDDNVGLGGANRENNVELQGHYLQSSLHNSFKQHYFRDKREAKYESRKGFVI
jgi:hypothetical protein